MTEQTLPLQGVRWFFSRRLDGPWPNAIRLVSIAWTALLVIFFGDAAHMAQTWWNSSTFNHCLIILPILGWLVMQRKPELMQLTPESWWPALLWFGAGAGGWLLGEAAGVALARQAGLVMMLQGSAAAILGPQVVRGLLFPLFYMFFLVPFGEEFVPALQLITADICMWMLALVGVPAYIDGIFITTPAGYFRVAEACSGVKFLVAMVAYGALVSNLCFKSWYRRAGFMAISVIVPILANGLRAFGTIYIAEFRGIEFAASWDHVFYGWVFFAIVLVLVMGIGWRFFDRKVDEPAFDPKALKPMAFGLAPLRMVLPALAAIGLLPLAWSALVLDRASPVPAAINMPQVAGWEIVPYAPTKDWRPRFDGGSHYLFGRYLAADGKQVDLFAVVYDRQEDGREVVGYGQGAIDPDGEWSWVEDTAAPQGGHAQRIKAPGPVIRDVFTYYRINGVTTGSPTQVKLETLKAKMLGGDQQTVGIMLSSEYRGGASQRAAIEAFVNDTGGIDKIADRMAGLD